jgi:hypothetical protein
MSAFVFCPETHVKKVFGNPIFFFQKAVQEKGTEKAPGPAGRGALNIGIWQDQYTQISEMQVS